MLGSGHEVEEPQSLKLYSGERVAPGEAEGVAVGHLSVIGGADVP